MLKEKESKFCKVCIKEYKKSQSSYLNYCSDECKEWAKNKKYNSKRGNIVSTKKGSFRVPIIK